MTPRTVDRVVSVGSNCEVTDSIRDYFGTDRAYPFDWWITPVSAVTRLVEARFEGLLDPGHLRVSADRDTVVCSRYQLLHHHDFARGADGKVLPDIAAQVPAVQEKFHHLARRFFADCRTGHTLFVRNRAGDDPHLAGVRDDTSDDAMRRLYRTLRDAFPEARVTLLVTNVGRKGELDGGAIVLDEITDYNDGYAHRVSPRGWKELFERQGFSLAR